MVDLVSFFMGVIFTFAGLFAYANSGNRKREKIPKSFGNFEQMVWNWNFEMKIEENATVMSCNIGVLEFLKHKIMREEVGSVHIPSGDYKFRGKLVMDVIGYDDGK